MPRPRKPQAECDCLECRDASILASLGAQPLPPQPKPKCLILYLDGLQLQGDSLDGLFTGEGTLPHLDRIVREGASGLLALRGSGTTQEKKLSQLLGVFEERPTKAASSEPASSETQGLSRYPRLRANFYSASAWAQQIAGRAGFKAGFKAVVPDQHAPQKFDEVQSWRAPQQLSPTVAPALGLSSEPGIQHARTNAILSTPPDAADLVFWHVSLQDALPPQHLPSQSDALTGSQHLSAGGQDPAGGSHAQQAVLRWLDEAVSGLQQLQSNEGTALLLVVLMGCEGGSRSVVPPGGGGSCAAFDQGAFGGVQRPVQSFERAGLDHVDIAQGCFIVSLQCCPGYIRRDSVDRLSVERIQAAGCHGCILADRLLPELAFKLGFAAKYGA